MRVTPVFTSAAATSALFVGFLVVAPPAPAEEAATGPAEQAARPTAKIPTAVGKGGAVSTVDPEASAAALKVLKNGGNAADAAVAAAATLGVTEPYSAGIGGGGYFVYYNAERGTVGTVDGRETAPMNMPTDAFIDPATGKPYNFTPELVTSGVSVGTPGTPATWHRVLKKWGTLTMAQALKPAIKVATRGFEVDETFRQQTLDNEVRFGAFRASRKLFLPDGDAPAVGSIFRNPDLAATYADLGNRGLRAFYRGKLAKLMVDVVRNPRTTSDTELPGPERLPLATRPLQVQGAQPVADQGHLPRLRRLRDGALLQWRLDRRRGAQHHGAHRLHRQDARAGAAHLPRGRRARLRRPCQVRR
jgi:gamma-glutamyltranspeptidase/glutathione hydrolase